MDMPVFCCFVIISQVPCRLSAGFQQVRQDLIETSPANECLQKKMFIIVLLVLSTLHFLGDKVFNSMDLMSTLSWNSDTGVH